MLFVKSVFKVYLGDSGALEDLPAVHPAVDAGDALSPVAPQLLQQTVGGGARAVGQAEVRLK